MYSIGWYSAPRCLPDSVEDGYESAEEAWDDIASDLYMYGDESRWEFAQDMATRTGEGVANIDITGLAYVEVWEGEK